MAIADVAEYAHLSDADLEALGCELEAIRRDIEDSRGENDRAYIRRAIAFQRCLDVAARLVIAGSRSKAGVGVLVIVAASRSEPNTATGLDEALKPLGAQPYGAALLIAAGLGIITYGLYSFAMARYTKM